MQQEASDVMSIREINGTRVALYQGPTIADEQGAVDAIGACYGLEVDLVVLPVEHLADEFFRLGSKLAGGVLQKFVNYGLRVAVMGELSSWTGKSQPLRDFVAESNRGGQVLFVPDISALQTRL